MLKWNPKRNGVRKGIKRQMTVPVTGAYDIGKLISDRICNY